MIGKIYDIQGFSIHDGPGLRTTVFLKGCPLHCLWCHSPESMSPLFELAMFGTKCIGTDICGKCLAVCPTGAAIGGAPSGTDRSMCNACLKCTEVCPSKARAPSGRNCSVDEIFDRIEQDRLFFGKDGGLTISGGEPMEQFDFAYALAKRFKQNAIGVCLDTSGYADPELFLRIMPYVDLFLYDLKHMDSKRLERLAGVPNGSILENAKMIAEKGGKLQIRIPVIPKLNDDERNMRQTAEFCRSLGEAVSSVQLLPFHKLGNAKYTRLGKAPTLKKTEPPSDGYMRELMEMMASYGFAVYIH